MDGKQTIVFILKTLKSVPKGVKSKLFRPPYGKISLSQSKVLKQKYKIVMWDVLSADFDLSITPEKCARNVLDNASKGSIIVMHDSVKAEKIYGMRSQKY